MILREKASRTEGVEFLLSKKSRSVLYLNLANSSRDGRGDSTCEYKQRTWNRIFLVRWPRFRGNWVWKCIEYACTKAVGTTKRIQSLFSRKWHRTNRYYALRYISNYYTVTNGSAAFGKVVLCEKKEQNFFIQVYLINFELRYEIILRNNKICSFIVSYSRK